MFGHYYQPDVNVVHTHCITCLDIPINQTYKLYNMFGQFCQNDFLTPSITSPVASTRDARHLWREDKTMSQKSKFTRRRVLGGLVTIGAGSAIAGAGTLAAFSDEDTSEDNTVAAGTLTLSLANGGDNEGSKTIEVTNAKPGDSGRGASNIKNEGTIDGSVDLEVTNVRNNENGRNDPEREAGDESGDQGELGQNLNVWIGFDRDDEELRDNRTAGQPATDTETDEAFAAEGETINEAEGNTVEGYQLNSGDSANLVVEWEIPEDTGNEVQSDEVLFDLVVTLNQA